MGALKLQMLLCPSPGDEVVSKGNISDKNWYNKQFFWLNESLKLTLFKFQWNTELEEGDYELANLNLGKNYGISVEEVMHPYIGLCYALTFETYKISLFEGFVLKAEFGQEQKTPRVEISILNPDD